MEFKNLTGQEKSESLKFIEEMNRQNKKVWIRQVVVPGLMDNDEYIEKLALFLNKINNIEKIEFLPYHKLGSEKYEKLNITNPYKDLEEMNKEKCNELYERFITVYNQIRSNLQA